MSFTVDSGLIGRARSEPRALDQLIRQIWPEIYRVARGIVRDAAAAEDAAQEACASIARALPVLRSDGAFYGWMYRIAGRCALAAARQSELERIALAPAAQVDHTAAIDVRRAIGFLPPAQRAAIVLHYYADLSSAEIGKVLGVPSATVRFHLMLARRTLAKTLGSDGAALEEGCEHA